MLFYFFGTSVCTPFVVITMGIHMRFPFLSFLFQKACSRYFSYLTSNIFPYTEFILVPPIYLEILASGVILSARKRGAEFLQESETPFSDWLLKGVALCGGQSAYVPLYVLGLAIKLHISLSGRKEAYLIFAVLLKF